MYNYWITIGLYLFSVCLLMLYAISFIITLLHKRHDRKKIEHKAAFSTAEKKDRCLLLILNYFEGMILYITTLTGKIPSQRARRFFYKYVFGMKIGQRTVIYNSIQIRSAYRISIGDGTVVGEGCVLDGREGLDIGENVNLSSGVWIWTLQHDPQSSDFRSIGGRVTIGDRAWISSRVTILPGVTIGNGAVIAANAVVTRDVEPYGIYGGIPAKKIAERNKNINYVFSGDFLPFI
jgi:acetyltransferase-like isoleucine patch superfamily enzyme